MKKSTSESCGHDPSTGEKLCPPSETKEPQPQKEEVAPASASSEPPEKTESSEKESDPHPAEAEPPKGESKEEKKRIVSFKVKKSVPSRMAKTAPASVAKPVLGPVAKPAPAPVDESAPAPVDESAPAPVTAPPAESSSDEPPVDDHGSCHMKPSTHGFRPKKNSLLVKSSTGLPSRTGRHVATTTESGETASSILKERLDFDSVCFLGFGVGMAIIGVCLGYGTWKILFECMEFPMSLVFKDAILFMSVLVISSMLAWALHLGILANGSRGFAKTFKGWLVVFVITIIVFIGIGGMRRNDFLEAAAQHRRSLSEESQGIGMGISMPEEIQGIKRIGY